MAPTKTEYCQAGTEYAQAGAVVLRQLADLALRREWCALLGPLHAGKRHLLRRLRGILLEEGVALGQVRFLEPAPDDAPPYTETVGLSLDAAVWIEPNEAAVLNWLDTTRDAQLAVLLASNVDALPHARTRRLLDAICARTAAGHHLAVVLTGGVGLRTVLDEPAWAGVYRFVVQGFAQDEFWAFAEHYLARLSLRLDEPPPGLIETLYERSGQNPYLARLVLLAACDRWAGCGGEKTQSLHPADLVHEVATIRISWNRHFQDVTLSVRDRPGCWGDLEVLASGSPVRIASETPTDLELIGAAVRDRHELRPAGSVMAEFLHDYYTPRRMADLLALNGRWSEAFERYQRPTPADASRGSPSSAADVGEVVRALCLSLEGCAAQGAQAVRTQFANGCRWILGFPEVTFWRWDEDRWKAESQGAEPQLDRYREVLPLAPGLPGLVPVAPDRAVLVARLPTTGAGGGAVVVGDPAGTDHLSEDRREFARQVVESLVSAVGQASRIEWDEGRLRARDGYAAIVDEIVASIGAEVRDVHPILVKAAVGLRRMGYRRVLVCLIDPAGNRLRGVWEESDDPDRTLLQVTDYTLDDQQEALHKEVVATGKTRVFRDAAREPRANQEGVLRSQLKAGAIVPLMRPGGRAVGTVMVEPAVGGVPPEEVRDLEEFGRHLAVLLQLGEQVSILLAALDKLPEPVFVADQAGRLRYANARAGRYLPQLPIGWQPAERAVRFDQLTVAGPVGEIIHRYRPTLEGTLRDGISRVQHLEVGDGKELFHVALYTERLTNLADEPIGAVGCSLDLSYLHRVFDALRHLNQADDARSFLDRTTEATQRLGHREGALYRIGEDSQSVTLGKASYGLSEARANCNCPACATFFVPPTQNCPGWEAWLCAFERKPVVFRSGGPEADRAEGLTPRGLAYRNVREPFCPQLKARGPGAMWIDFPLLSDSGAVGKLTLDCHERYRPDDFEFLTVLCELVADLLASWERWDKMVREKELGLAEGVGRVLRDVCQHFGSGLAWLEPLRTDLRHRARDDRGAWETVFGRFDSAYHHLHGLLGGVREFLMEEVEVRPVTSDLTRVLREAFDSSGVRWTLNGFDPSGAGPLQATIDRRWLQQALEELIDNARQCHSPTAEVRIEVTAEWVRRADRDWLRLGFANPIPSPARTSSMRLSDPFEHLAASGSSRAGLGLFFVLRVAEAHGGSARLDPNYPDGTRVVMEIPGTPAGPGGAEQ